MPVPNQSLRTTLGSDPTAVVQLEQYADMAGCFGHGSWFFHRVDLHRGLRDLATAPSSAGISDDTDIGPPVELSLGCEVVGVDCEEGVLTLAGGRAIAKNLVIIADGARSRLISDLTGQPSEVHRTGRSIYRWLVSTDEVMAEPALRALYTRELPGFTAWHDPHNQVFWVSYTCRGGTILNNAVLHDTRVGEGEGDIDADANSENLWHSPVSKSEVLAVVENFHPAMKTIVTMASEDGIKVHHAHKRPPLASFVRGRTAVVGDAAHVMLPTHAAGAGVAIESAASLEVLFRGVDGKDGVVMGQRMELFDRLRIPRCNLTMLASNGGPEWTKVPGFEQEVRRFYSGPLPPPCAMPYSKAFREVLFRHDEFHAAGQALAEAMLLS
ncbi:FAD/NAD(P)-binding domain-containing protein [Parathielavia hyrcaniae]|uniref:FAD/NAD(P)-binding domain-containing protein n=1 Tax=Parathielavia hyrcaniae TaxID=113614 RepID=A0AAN6PYN0_9PEZI|nr:FAD/NAD(P)-binding domain-containing protein [Parathielavia hyrcaniae]